MISVEKKWQMEGHLQSLYTLERGLAENQFLSAGGDQLIVLWDLEKNESVTALAKATSTVYSLCYVQSRKLLIAGNKEGGLHFVNIENKAPLKFIQLNAAPVFDILYNENNYSVIVAGGDGTLSTWNPDDFSHIKSARYSDSAVRCLAFHPLLNHVAAGYSDNKIRIFDASDLSLLHELEGHTLSVFSLEYSPDGKFLLSGGRDAHLRIWDVKERYQLRQSIVGHLYTINSIRFHPDGRYFATGSRDKTIKIWDSSTFQLLKVIDKARNMSHSHSVNKLLWHSFDKTLISCGDDKLIMGWKILFSD